MKEKKLYGFVTVHSTLDSTKFTLHVFDTWKESFEFEKMYEGIFSKSWDEYVHCDTGLVTDCDLRNFSDIAWGW